MSSDVETLLKREAIAGWLFEVKRRSCGSLEFRDADSSSGGDKAWRRLSGSGEHYTT